MNQPHVMVATPCYGGMVHEPYLRGLTSLVTEISGAGLPVHLATVVNESLITRARNELVKHFMMTECTHLMFIDSDISFGAEDVIKLLNHDKDIVVGAYPLKGLRWSNLSGITGDIDPDEVRRRVTEYVVNFQFASEKDAMEGKLDVVEGLIEVKDAGTGFMCIKRNVIETMIEKMPELTYRREVRFLMNDKDDGVRWAIFDCEIDKDDGRYLSEDYLFCRRWQRLGGKVWLDPTIILTHVGTYSFQGSQFFEFHELQDAAQQPTSKPGLIGG